MAKGFKRQGSGFAAQVTGFGPTRASLVAQVTGFGAASGAVLTSIVVTPAAPTIAYPATQQFVATGHYSDGTTAVITGVVAWASATPSVGTISAGGLLTSVLHGTTLVTATLGAISGSTTATVTTALVSIAVTPANPSIAFAATEQFVATGHYDDGTTADVTASSTWASATPTVATIDAASGLATGVLHGSSVITATVGAISGNTTLTVTRVLVSITLSPLAPTIQTAGVDQLTATGHYDDGSTADLTMSGSVWASATPAVASVIDGLVTGIAAGSSVITSTSGAVIGSTTATVFGWSKMTTSGSPPSARFEMGSCYVPPLNGTVYFGGTVDGTTAIDNTVYFRSDAGAWSTLATTNTPSKRLGFGCVWDSVNSRVVIAGGYDSGYKGTASRGEVWALNTSTLAWTDISASVSPERCIYARMAYRASVDRCLLWCSQTPALAPSDKAYERDTLVIAVNWTQMPNGGGAGPSARNAPMLVCDETRGKFVLVSGSTLDTQTWETPGQAIAGAWTNVSGSIAGAPVARVAASAAWSAVYGMMTFGGNDGGSTTYQSTQFYSGATWTTPMLAQEPPGRSRGCLTWNSTTSRFELWSGQGANTDTWIYS